MKTEDTKPIKVEGTDATQKNINPLQKPKQEMVNIGTFFRYLKCEEKLLLIVGSIASVLCGVITPGISIASGQIINAFNPHNTVDEILEKMQLLAGVITLVGVGTWIFGYMYYAFWQHLAENITYNLRSRYLKSILRQDITFFEKQNVEQIPQQIGNNFFAINDALGEKLANIIFSVSCLLSGVGMSIFSGVDLSAVCLAFFPFIFLILAIFMKQAKKTSIAKMGAVKKLGGVIEESMQAIRLIVSFANESKEEDKVNKLAEETKKVSQKQAFVLSLLIGYFKIFLFGFYCYSLYLGTIWIDKKMKNPSKDYDTYTTGDIVGVFISLAQGMMQLFGVAPNIQALIQAKIAGKQIFDVIDRVPDIKDDKDSVSSFKLEKEIRFEGVSFRYPTQPEKTQNVLNGISFRIKAGETTAIVGPSGSGKSTIVQMIERFYDPLGDGKIYFDDLNIKEIQLKCLRESIGYVSQEPVLIIGTVKDNLLFGNKDATENELLEALSKANANFIFDMENKLDTYIGSSAVLNLSGGQKQRIAIARALIKKPKILILDEATSALDPKSEKEVQDAIEHISQVDKKQLTIVMIAHRLQTIQTAQNLLYIENKNTMLAAAKGTPEYNDIMKKLEEQNYAHQLEDEQKKKRKTSVVEEEENKEDELQTNRDVETEFGALEQKTHSKQEVQIKPATYSRIMSYYKPQALAYIVLLCSIVNALAFPIFGFLMSKILFVMLINSSDNFSEQRAFWCGMFLLHTFVVGLAAFLSKYTFGYIGENLTCSVRKLLFSGILYKDIAWFDHKDHAPGVLSNVMSEDINALNGMTTESFSQVFECFLTIAAGMVIAFAFTWKMALITLAIVPLVALGGIGMAKLQWKSKPAEKLVTQDKEDPYKKSNALLSDIIMNYRTVISFGEKNIDYAIKMYDDLLQAPKRSAKIGAHFSGVFYGYSQFIKYAFIAGIYYITAVFIYKYGEEVENTYIGVYVLFISALGAGVTIQRIPSIPKAKKSARKIFEIIDTQSKIDSRDKTGDSTIKNGEIEFVNASFKYPSRNTLVLNQLDLKVHATRKIALVGHSGCGKSTIANLLLRMYDIVDGNILIDGKDIKEYNVAELRRQIGIVMQEPLLFNTTIKENILYGNDKADDMRVRQVAEMANALQFIESNIEDLDKDEVKIEIEKKFRLQVKEKSETHKNIMRLEIDFDSQSMTFEEISLIQEILERTDTENLNLINSNIEQFEQTVKQSYKKRGIKWDDILIKFGFDCDFNQAKKSMIDKNVSVDQQIKVIQFILETQLFYDTIALHDFVKQLQFLEKRSDTTILLENILKEHQSRIKAETVEKRKRLNYKKQDGEFKLHEGFNKECGLKGSKLSGGQKQRIAIARALIKDPKILILDEATSALDEQSQEIVQQALDRAMEGRTSIVIAHRLSTIRNCEWLFVIHNGKVVEQGTYEGLSANPDSYFFKLKSGMEM